MSVLPIRVRLTLPFAVAMAAVLAALGGFVYTRVGSALLQSTDQALLAHATESTSGSTRGGRCSATTRTASAFAQVLDRGRARRDLGPGGHCGAARRRRRVAGWRRAIRSGRRVSIPGRSGRWRLLAVPGAGPRDARRRQLAATVRDESLERLRHELLIASPLALLLAALAGLPARRGGAPAGRGDAAQGRRRSRPRRREAGCPVPRARDEVSRLAETLNFMLERLEAAFEHERRVRRRREPRAADAARAAAHRARARASPSALARGAGAGAALGRRGRRPAQRARRRPAAARPLRSAHAAGAARAALVGCHVHERRRPVRGAREGARAHDRGRSGRRARRSTPIRGRSSRRSPTWSRTRSSTDAGTVTLSARQRRGRGRTARARRGSRVPARLRRPRLRPLQPRRRGAAARRQRARPRDRADDRGRPRWQRRGFRGRRRGCLDLAPGTRPAGPLARPESRSEQAGPELGG